MLNKYTTSKLHKHNPIVYIVEPVRTNLKQNKKVRNKDYIEIIIYLTFICIYLRRWQTDYQTKHTLLGGPIKVTLIIAPTNFVEKFLFSSFSEAKPLTVLNAKYKRKKAY